MSSEGISGLSALPDIAKLLDGLSQNIGLNGSFSEMVSELDQLDDLKDKFKILAKELNLPPAVVDLTLHKLSETWVNSDPAEALKEAYAAAMEQIRLDVGQAPSDTQSKDSVSGNESRVSPISPASESGMDSKFI